MTLLDTFLRTAAQVGEYFPSTRAVAAKVEPMAKNIAYRGGNHRDQRLDVWRPKGVEGPLPVLFHVHGGGFRILSKDSHVSVARRFALAGFCVVNVSYRLTPEGAFPSAFDDVAAALMWTLDNAGDFGGDVSRIAYAGESAGANLILATALAGCARNELPAAAAIFERNPSPFAILPACGMLEVHNPERYTERSDLPKWVRKRVRMVCEGYLGSYGDDAWLASPLRRIESDEALERPLPPVLSVCGGIDPVLNDTERLGRALAKHGQPDATRIYKGQHHAFHLFPLKASADAWRVQLEHLAAHLSEPELG